MAALNFLNRSDKKKGSATKQPRSVSQEASKETRAPGAGRSSLVLKLRKPIISEKASRLQENRAYTFEVDKSANKIEIKKAVEGLYSVTVEKVRIVVVHSKRIRVRRVQGWRPGHKKAMVTVAQGQSIETI